MHDLSEFMKGFLLRAGGMELMHDGKRAADEDNPEGHWEWEEIKSLKKNPRVIEQAAGKVIKIISALLPHLAGDEPAGRGWVGTGELKEPNLWQRQTSNQTAANSHFQGI